MSKPKPSDLHPGLTYERLRAVAKIIVEARHALLPLREKNKGDTEWASGCRAYEWIRHAVVSATATHKWLTIIEGGARIETPSGTKIVLTRKRFVFGIGSVPVRFYRGNAGRIPDNSLRIAFPELNARNEAFLFRSEASLLPRPDALRLAVETDHEGEVVRVTLVQVLDVKGKVLGETWVIFERAENDIAKFEPRKEEPKNLGKPSVGSRKKRAKEERGEK